jgi:hypothetical protein
MLRGDAATEDAMKTKTKHIGRRERLAPSQQLVMAVVGVEAQV